MSHSLKARIWTAASQYVGLTALLGTSPFRMFDQQLPQGIQFPAVVMESVGNPHDYVASGPLPTSWSRMQFRIYGTGNDSENANLIANALANFFNTFNGTGIDGMPTYPNYVVQDIDFGIAKTQPLTYMRLVDVRIYSNQDAT